jgi:hypothetical protein
MWRPEQLDEWRQETDGLSVFHVVVYCPRDVLLERMNQQNSSSDVSAHRDPRLSIPRSTGAFQKALRSTIWSGKISSGCCGNC